MHIVDHEILTCSIHGEMNSYLKFEFPDENSEINFCAKCLTALLLKQLAPMTVSYIEPRPSADNEKDLLTTGDNNGN